MTHQESPADALVRNAARLADSLRQLGDDGWAAPSLCTEWTNHEVLAHLVIGYSAPLSAVARAMVESRGRFDAANTTMARTLAATHTPAELLRGFDEARVAPSGLGRIFPPRLLLGDHVIHELDILLALDRKPQVPADVLVAVLNTEVSVPNPFVPARTRARGLHLRADDVDWEHRRAGDDRLVVGAAADLASVLAGRGRAFERLSGPGLEHLGDRLDATP